MHPIAKYHPQGGVILTLVTPHSKLPWKRGSQPYDNTLGNYVRFYLLPEIVHPPNSTIVFLNKTAVFTCETRGGSADWLINGILFDMLPPEIRIELDVTDTITKDGRIGELTIPAGTDFNGTVVQCVVLTLSGLAAESENVTLKIQGMLVVHAHN